MPSPAWGELGPGAKEFMDLSAGALEDRASQAALG